MQHMYNYSQNMIHNMKHIEQSFLKKSTKFTSYGDQGSFRCVHILNCIPSPPGANFQQTIKF